MARYYTDNPDLISGVVKEELSYGEWNNSIKNISKELSKDDVLQEGDIVFEFYDGCFYEYVVISV